MGSHRGGSEERARPFMDEGGNQGLHGVEFGHGVLGLVSQNLGHPLIKEKANGMMAPGAGGLKVGSNGEAHPQGERVL